MNTLFFHYFTYWRSLGYALVFAGMIIEGDIFLFTASFLARQGFFDIGYLAFFAASGALAGDLLWYALGHCIDNHANSRAQISFVYKWVTRLALPFDIHLLNHPARTIFISKFAYGFHHALLMRFGMLRFSWQKFVKIDFISTLFWVCIVGTLGYVSGTAFIAAKQYFRFVEAGLLIGLAAFLLLEHWIWIKIKKS